MLSEESRKELLKIARQAVEAAVCDQPLPQLHVTDPELAHLRGAFVTLKKCGKLRGCIGTFEATSPLYDTVSRMAVSSATSDPRFSASRIQPEELAEIDIEISVLSPMRKLDDPLDLELGKHGIHIRHGHQSGCFLPQVADETGWSKEEFLSCCCDHKAGLAPDAWRNPETEVSVFEAEIIAEHEAGGEKHEHCSGDS